MEKNIVAHLLQDYDQFTKSEKKIADYVLAHQKETQYISITDLSAACKVAVATISVFCRKLGLAGFNDFKLELARADMAVHDDRPGGETITEQSLRAGQEALRMSAQLLRLEDLQRAVALLQQARYVACMGQGNSSAIAQVAWTQFSTVSPKFKTVQDSHLQAITLSTLDERDAVLYFSYSGATHEVMDAAQLAHSLGVKLILVTRYANAPAAEYADVILLCGPNEDPMRFGSTAALMCQMYVVDVLIGEYYRQNREGVEKYRGIVGKALMKKQL